RAVNDTTTYLEELDGGVCLSRADEVRCPDIRDAVPHDSRVVGRVEPEVSWGGGLPHDDPERNRCAGITHSDAIRRNGLDCKGTGTAVRVGKRQRKIAERIAGCSHVRAERMPISVEQLYSRVRTGYAYEIGRGLICISRGSRNIVGS